MTLSYKQFCLLWGKGLLVAAIIAAVAGLLLGDGDWVIVLYQCAAILLVLAVVFLVMGRIMQKFSE
ncbi:hypothetical protein [Methanorbis rubei]|uniref:hypothetical protein n=1 Tax=Methanorbis rubei TaxID=3028300 RepID=UPI0030B8A119